MITIPRLQEFLGLVQGCFPTSDCIIAGGAVRDTLHRRPVKDIDVFINSDVTFTGGVKRLGKALHTDIEWEGMESEEEDYPANESTFSVINVDKGIESVPCQLIFLLRDPVENLKAHFDFGLSMCWVTRWRLWCTPEYHNDALNRWITYCPREKPNEQQRKSSRERQLRLAQKYPEWKLRGIV